MTITPAWLKGLVGFFASGNGVSGTQRVSEVVLSTGVSGAYDERERTLTLTASGGGGSGGSSWYNNASPPADWGVPPNIRVEVGATESYLRATWSEPLQRLSLSAPVVTWTGGGLSAASPAGSIIVGTGIQASYNAGTRALSLSIAPTALAAQWRTVISVDFSLEEASQDLDADGFYSIGGVNFEFENTAGLHDSGYPWQVLSATGLRCRANASGTTFAARTAPALRYSLGAVLKDGAPVRARVQYASSSGSIVSTWFAITWPNTSYFVRSACIGNTAAGAYGWQELGMTRETGNGAGPTTVMSETAIGSPSVEGDQDVLSLIAPNGARPTRLFTMQLGSSNANGLDLADDANLADICSSMNGTSGAALTDNMGTSTRSRNAYVVLCPEFGTHSTSAHITYKRLIIEQYY